MTAEAAEAPPRVRGRYASGGVVENLIGVLPGTDPAVPGIMLMAHSDSVPGSPGAADDAAGVISALETVRALKAMGPHKRDVIVLITDGEEVGLLGARAFFASQDPLLKHIGMIVNMEARGGGGRVAMFETGAQNGAAIATFASAVKNTDALSLMSEIYKYLPNSTDFTVSKTAGYPGYNFAFTGEEFDYHSPSSTPAVLDQGSVQHMGDQALAITKALANSASLPGRRHDAIYSDVLGGPVIAYPPLVGWILLALSVGLAVFGALTGAKRSGEGLSFFGVARGFSAGLFTLLATATALHVAGRWVGTGDAVSYRDLLANFGWLFFGMSALAIGAVLLAWKAAVIGHLRVVVAGLALAGGLLSCLLGFDAFGLGLGVATAVLGALLRWPIADVVERLARPADPGRADQPCADDSRAAAVGGRRVAVADRRLRYFGNGHLRPVGDRRRPGVWLDRLRSSRPSDLVDLHGRGTGHAGGPRVGAFAGRPGALSADRRLEPDAALRRAVRHPRRGRPPRDGLRCRPRPRQRPHAPPGAGLLPGR